MAILLVVLFACAVLSGCGQKEPTLSEKIAESNKKIARNSQNIADINKNLNDYSKAIKSITGK